MRIEAYLRQSPVVQTVRMARRMEGSLNRLLKTEDLTAFEALVLAAIFFEGKGEVKPSTLAEAFVTTRSNISHCVSSLEARGLVVRRIDEDDARAMRLMLKPQGKKKAARVAGILDRVQRRLEEEIGAGKLTAMIAQMEMVAAVCEWT